MKRSTTKLTETMVARATHGTSRAGDPIAAKHWDAKSTGLCLVVTPKGVKTYFWKGDRDGKQIWIRLGRPGGMSLIKARAKADQLREKNLNGEDVRAEIQKERNPETVAQLVTMYRKNHLPGLRENTQYFIEGLLKNHILPKLGDRLVGKLTRQDLKVFIRSMEDTPFLANKAGALIRNLFAVANDEGWKLTNASEASALRLVAEKPRSRSLEAAELAAVGTALVDLVEQKEISQVAADAIRLLCFTGLRLNEAQNLRWERDPKADPGKSDPYVDLEARTLTLEWHKTSDDAGAKVLPLNPQAHALLKGRSGKSIHPFCFPGHRLMRPIVGLGKAWLKVREAAGMATKKKARKTPRKTPIKGPTAGSQDPRLHDLRRTFYTTILGLTGLYDVADVLTGHKLPKIKDTYGVKPALLPTFVQASADAGAWIEAALLGKSPAPGVKVEQQSKARA